MLKYTVYTVPYLPGSQRRGVEDAGLHLAGQGAVHGQDEQLGHLGAESLHPLVQDLTGRVDLLLARQEQQDVPCNTHHSQSVSQGHVSFNNALNTVVYTD